MSHRFRLFLVSIAVLAASGSNAQFTQVSGVVRPVAGRAALAQRLSAAGVRDLSARLENEAAGQSLVIDPAKVRAAAGVVAGPVVPAPPPVTGQPAQPPPQLRPTAATQVEFVPVSTDIETQLRGAIAANGNFKDALATGTASLITLPGVVRMIEEQGPPLQLKAFILVNQPFARDASGAFAGELLIGVTELDDSGVVRTLPVPLLFQVVGAARSAPEKILIETTSPPFKPVKIWMKAIEGGAAQLLVLSVINRQGTPISVPVEGGLDLDAASGSIEGLGLETTKLHVSAEAVADAGNRRVMLHVDPSGFLAESSFKLGADGSYETELRSDGIGTAVIRATSPGLAAATTEVRFRLPWVTFAASIFGALLGAGVSLSVAAPRKRAMVRLLGAAGFGIILFALYVIGVNLLPFAPKVGVGTVFVFAISAIAAFLGPAVASWRNRLPSP